MTRPGTAPAGRPAGSKDARAAGTRRREMGAEAKRQRSKLKINADYDYKLIACVVLLAGFGLVVLYSSSYYSQGSSMLLKQGVITGIGLICMIFMAEVDYHIFKPFAVTVYIVAILVTLLVLTPLGVKINGARRWLKLGPVTFQPAELMKLSLIVVMAGILSTYWKRLNEVKVTLLLLAVMLVPVFVTFKYTDNLSSAIILLIISYGMIFLAHPKDILWLLAAVAALAAAALFIYYIVAKTEYVQGESFRYTRLRLWFDPFNENYPSQVRQGLYAISTGGLFGRGLGNSMLKQGLLPEPYNDMIFAVLCEEMGLFGAAMVLYLFLYLVVRIFRIGYSAPDKFGFFLCVGVMLHLASQVILNVMVVTNTIMNTGITLCFFSGGGSSLIFLYLEMGLVLSVARRIQNPK